MLPNRDLLLHTWSELSVHRKVRWPFGHAAAPFDIILQYQLAEYELRFSNSVEPAGTCVFAVTKSMDLDQPPGCEVHRHAFTVPLRQVGCRDIGGTVVMFVAVHRVEPCRTKTIEDQRIFEVPSVLLYGQGRDGYAASDR